MASSALCVSPHQPEQLPEPGAKINLATCKTLAFLLFVLAGELAAPFGYVAPAKLPSALAAARARLSDSLLFCLPK